MEERPQERAGSGEVGTPRDRFLLLRWWDRVAGAWRKGQAYWRLRGPRLPRRRLAPPPPSEEEIARWVALLGCPDDPAHARALDELVVIGRPAVPALIEALRSETWIQAFRAGEALGLIGARRAVRPLKRLLNHPNSNVRWGACEALGRIRSRWARAALRRAQADENRTSWGETVGEAAERAVASIDTTWFSRLVNVFQILVYLALCAVVVYAAYRILDENLSSRAVYTPTVTPTVTARPTSPPSRTPTITPLPTFIPLRGTINNDAANVRDMPGGALIGQLHYGDEVLIHGGRIGDDGRWWYLITLYKINNAATVSAILEGGAYGWVYGPLIAGVEAPDLAPTVQAVETMRAGVATPTPLISTLETPTISPTITATATFTPTLSP